MCSHASVRSISTAISVRMNLVPNTLAMLSPMLWCACVESTVWRAALFPVEFDTQILTFVELTAYACSTLSSLV